MEELTLEEDYTFLEYGHMPGGWFDEGLSGGLDPLERPGFKSMMRFVESENIPIIVLYHNDRLARDVELTLRVVRTCKENGIEFLFGNLPDINIDTPEGKMLLTQMSSVGEYFRNDGKRKTKAGMARLRAEGRWLGETPYGFYAITKNEDEKEYGQLLYDFAELDALVKLFRHFTSSRPPSYAGTAKYLNEQGIPTRRGGQWTRTHVHKLLTKAVIRRSKDELGRKFGQYFPEEMIEGEKEDGNTTE
tara:strand:- start:1508 stop:2248 length:741 start_codon:yes stop_codon:yes gene_type:complete